MYTSQLNLSQRCYYVAKTTQRIPQKVFTTNQKWTSVSPYHGRRRWRRRLPVVPHGRETAGVGGHAQEHRRRQGTSTRPLTDLM
jgi:hypothetical protein